MAFSLQSADQFFSFVVSMGAMQFTKKPFMQDQRVIFILRVAFCASIILQALFAFYIRQKIIKTNDQKKFKMKNDPGFFKNAEADQQEEVEISYFEYDLNEVNKILRACLLQGIIVGIIHYKWNATQPLIIHALGIFRNLIFSSLYRAHIYGMNVLRPFELNMIFQKAEVPAQETVSQGKKKKED